MPLATAPIPADPVAEPRRDSDLSAQALPISGFGAGTVVTTDDGPVPVEWLRRGDKVQTFGGGFKPVRWIGRDCLWAEPQQVPAVRLPVLSGVTEDSPMNPLIAARHRVVLTGWQVELYFGLESMLVEAKYVSPAQICFPDRATSKASCMHLLFEAPEIIQANGAWVETMQLSSGATQCLREDAAEKIDRLDLDLAAHAQPAMGVMHGWEAQQLGLDLAAMLDCDPLSIARA
ncbi:Hint domain-containing protein [Litoreibacter ponti]|uniref:Hint domain-containing protein n=1 Tax=Litoreibacter ponti TaxID=1510457 RepID=A0A2T6BFB1_9RHOB|nr:Hint domain-containing protein [Litoreibacter ponti]PTX54753.1 Hint domain-containing protein [Litoreibacter ponti]